MNWLKKFWDRMFKDLTAREIALLELQEAEISLLEAQSGREYAEACVTYHQTRINRLKAYLTPTKAAS
jgi:hypothetical protein